MYEKILAESGLSEKQAQVYCACLASGKTKAPAIAKQAGLKRSTVYGILDELTSLGLVSVSLRGRIKYFHAKSPRAILDILTQHQERMQQSLPGLMQLYMSHHLQPRVESFEGAEGIKRIFEDTLTCKSKKILQIIRVKDFLSFPGGNFAKEYIHKRIARGITAYALNPASGDTLTDFYGKESQALKRFTRYLPPDLFYASMIMVYDYKVAMVSTKTENFGFIIESKEFSNTLKAYFSFLWKLGSKEPQKT